MTLSELVDLPDGTPVVHPITGMSGILRWDHYGIYVQWEDFHVEEPDAALDGFVRNVTLAPRKEQP